MKIFLSRLSCFVLLSLLVFAAACKGGKQPEQAAEKAIPRDTVLVAIDTPEVIPCDPTLYAVLYQQVAAENRGLCYQAFLAARAALQEDLKDKQVILPRAIIADIDETILDNSPYQAALILKGQRYPWGWDEWCMEARAKAIPGALEFLKYAGGFGVDIFYVTNRKESLREVTIKNLISEGFPMAGNENLLMRQDEKSKEPRRKAIAERYHISLLIGDNLTDFSDVFEMKDPYQRIAITDSIYKEFGRKFIILPNAMYGDWENAIYKYRFNLPEAEKTLSRYNYLEGF